VDAVVDDLRDEDERDVVEESLSPKILCHTLFVFRAALSAPSSMDSPTRANARPALRD